MIPVSGHTFRTSNSRNTRAFVAENEMFARVPQRLPNSLTGRIILFVLVAAAVLAAVMAAVLG